MNRTAWLQDRRMQKFRDVLSRWECGELSMVEAGELLGVSERQFRRYRERYEEDGLEGLIDRRLGKPSPKRVLAIPDLEHAKTAVLNSLTSLSGQRTYDHAIREFVAWYCSKPRLAFSRTVVLRYRIHLEQRGYAPATINLRLAAVRRIAYEAADAGLLSPELAAGIRRVKGLRRIGVRLGNWLTPDQGRRLLDSAVPSTARHSTGSPSRGISVCAASWCIRTRCLREHCLSS